ncbi:hypothetical protein RSOLAG1IB_12589 [Rhizoctonia solani AG-1 IB]|uniref:DDE Tnp4 domain-containing protein n=1 Tax=Thanatephorus cucumeris (strain AG1-IB / isolate 7/3/14) TaxID=1108050 RepID=A0A0B7FYS5_THACB|nr:hypothetical protein RSOLAG1IB_12589 [Rhizoctonia solani AG-1 IB]
MDNYRHQNSESDDDDDDELILHLLIDHDSLVIPRFLCLRRRNRNTNPLPKKRERNYLKRAQLQQAPMGNSGWQSIYRSREDRAYINVLGIDVATFDYLLDLGFCEAWNTRPIKRTDTNQTGSSRIGARSLDAAGGLGLALHYICSTMSEVSLQIIFALVPSTVSRYIDFALEILLEILKQIPEAHLGWPDEAKMRTNSRLINQKHCRAKYLRGAFGFMDGLNLPLQASGDNNEQNSNYNGWLHKHVISNILVFSPDGEFLY